MVSGVCAGAVRRCPGVGIVRVRATTLVVRGPLGLDDVECLLDPGGRPVLKIEVLRLVPGIENCDTGWISEWNA